jgi:hypothetical protein
MRRTIEDEETFHDGDAAASVEADLVPADLVPADHFYRQLDRLLDLTFVASGRRRPTPGQAVPRLTRSSSSNPSSRARRLTGSPCAGISATSLTRRGPTMRV